MTVSVLWLFLTVPWIGLQCLIVIFPDHTHLPSHCPIFSPITYNHNQLFVSSYASCQQPYLHLLVNVIVNQVMVKTSILCFRSHPFHMLYCTLNDVVITME